MTDKRITKKQLLGELSTLRRQLADSEEYRGRLKSGSGASHDDESAKGEKFFQAIVHDVTNREQAVRGLRESENLFRDLTEKSVAGVYLIQDWVFKYVNPMFAEIFGYSVEELTTNVGPADVVMPEDWPTVRENIRKRIFEEATSIHSEFRICTKDGEIRNVEVYGSRTMYQGKPAVVGTLLNITERKRSEERLRQAERKYRSIFENAIEGIFQSTPEGQIVAANPAHARILGYDSPEDLILSLTDIMHQTYVDPDRRTEFLHMLERDGIALSFECEFFRKDGSKIWVSLNAHDVRDEDGKTLHYEGTLEDITQKRKAESELRLLNEFNKAIIDHAPVAIFTLDKERSIHEHKSCPGFSFRSWGPGRKRNSSALTGSKTLIQYNVVWLSHIERGLRGEPFQLWDFPFTTYRGDRNIFMDFKGVPLEGKQREIDGLLCIIEETTDRVRTRTKLMQEAKMSAIGRLAAGIAHELNNPLGTVVAYSERASGFLKSHRGMSEKEWDLEKLEDYLTIIEEEAFRCKGVTTDILGLFQKESLEIAKIDINQLLNHLLAHMNLEKTNVKIVKEAGSPLPYILGDTSALRQVFVNLIANALDAAEGRVGATIWIRTRHNDNHVLVEIEDNGLGIPDSIMDKIFEPFFTTKKAKSGIGLGLALCYDLICDMG